MNKYPRIYSLVCAILSTSLMAGSAQAKRQCEVSTLSGIGYANTQSRAEDNATQAWRDNAKNNFRESFTLKDSKITSDIRCNRNKRRIRRIVQNRTTDPVVIGSRNRAWICDISATPCVDVPDQIDARAEPNGKVWARAQRRLKRRGFEYTEVKTITACKRNRLFRMQVSDNRRKMFRNKKDIGPCPYGGASVDDVTADLKRFGYSYVVMHRTANGFAGKACRKDRYFKLTADRFGENTRKTNIGECPHGGLSRKQVRNLLAKEGYTKLKFIDATPPNYKVRGCFDGDSYVMNIDRNGRIHGSYSDKRCGRNGYSISRIRSILQRARYKDIEFTDDKLPKYVAEVCQDRNRLALTINRWGEIRRQKRVGRCRNGVRRGPGGRGPRWKRSAEILKNNGYYLINYQRTNQDTREHYFKACRGAKRYKITMKRGEIIARKRGRGLSFLQCVVPPQ